MEERTTRRCLRNNSNCVGMQNMFRSNQYIINSASQCLPPEILTKVKRFSQLTCDDVNSLTFLNNQSHANALDRMNEVIQLQKNYMNNKVSVQRHQLRNFPLNVNSNGGLLMDQKQPRMIKSQQHQHDNQYKQYLQKYDRGQPYQKHNQFNSYGEEILYNQFFRNDLENLFLQ